MNFAGFLRCNCRPAWAGLALCLAGLAARADSPAAEAGLAAANSGFAFDLLKQIVKEQPGANIFVSPFSVSTVLQMVEDGAGGETKVEMRNVLKTDRLTLAPGGLHSACRDLNRSLNSQTNATLCLANAIWYQDSIRLRPGFVSDNQDFFDAKLATVDFSRPGSAETINDWADKSTRGKIRQIVQWPFPPLTRVILANAIYFKGQWVKPFDKNQTRPHAFHSSSGDRQIPMMSRHGRFGYQEGADFQAVELPYGGGRLQMYLFLPGANSSPAGSLSDLNGDNWREKVLPRFADREGTLALPRFKLDYEVNLNDSLMALGMRSAFTPAADFSAMAAEPLLVNQVRQKSFVDVNEEGTEAAAVTTVRMTALAVIRPRQPFEMIVDRPFFFIIADQETQSILFMGVVWDPAN